MTLINCLALDFFMPANLWRYINLYIIQVSKIFCPRVVAQTSDTLYIFILYLLFTFSHLDTRKYGNFNMFSISLNIVRKLLKAIISYMIVNHTYTRLSYELAPRTDLQLFICYSKTR